MAQIGPKPARGYRASCSGRRNQLMDDPGPFLFAARLTHLTTPPRRR